MYYFESIMISLNYQNVPIFTRLQILSKNGQIERGATRNFVQIPAYKSSGRPQNTRYLRQLPVEAAPTPALCTPNDSYVSIKIKRSRSRRRGFPKSRGRVVDRGFFLACPRLRRMQVRAPRNCPFSIFSLWHQILANQLQVSRPSAGAWAGMIC